MRREGGEAVVTRQLEFHVIDNSGVSAASTQKLTPGLDFYKGESNPSPHFGNHPPFFIMPESTNLILTAAIWILRLNSKCESSALCFSPERNKMNPKSQRKQGCPLWLQLGLFLSPQSPGISSPIHLQDCGFPWGKESEDMGGYEA